MAGWLVWIIRTIIVELIKALVKWNMEKKKDKNESGPVSLSEKEIKAALQEHNLGENFLKEAVDEAKRQGCVISGTDG
ncbi:hypothetical protein CDL15_Pgr027462 [Punica granatum]|uniref:Uncharacterized protein n=1 Tax=Punica granatum TaxID=22663 RepID=A0A218XHI5_PUNGR|nr:hypothetical protein CDL15_Pgr027462 [Punica granatum]PKI69904.1 hypothetical protein CRG98_009779 [Punica granatum]